MRDTRDLPFDSKTFEAIRRSQEIVVISCWDPGVSPKESLSPGKRCSTALTTDQTIC